jgi:hypothetical protein
LNDEWGVKGFEEKGVMMMVVKRGVGPCVSWKGEIGEGGRILHHEATTFSRRQSTQHFFGWIEARSLSGGGCGNASGGGNSSTWQLRGQWWPKKGT